MSQAKLGPSPAEVEFILNHKAAYAPLSLGAEVVRRSKRVYKGVYDFSISGGAIGSIQLLDPAADLGVAKKPLILPPSFIISNVLIDVLVNPLSGGAATLALTSGVGAGDVLGATAKAAFVGILAGIPISAATSIKIPAATALPGLVPSIVIAAAALTAGKCNVHFEGFLSD